MILIMGGAFQGKEEAARRMAAAGENGEKREVISRFHERVREYLHAHPEAGEEKIRAFAAETAESCPTAVTTMDEVGCGVVPMDREERRYREAAGWAGQELAARAETVWRMLAGIPMRIK